MTSKKTKIMRRKVYLPKWQRFFILPLLIFIWSFVTYLEFFAVDESEKMGLVGYLFFCTIFLFVAIMMWLMTSGRLPSYIIEEEK